MSDKRKTTFGLKLGQLADLFAVAVKNEESSEADYTEENLPQMLHDEMAEVMPGSSLLFPTVSEISTSRQSDVALLVGQSLRQLFFGSDSSIGQLQLIKEASKLLTGTLVSGARCAVANTIYHAAIARCLTLHNKKITKHTYKKLDQSFALLMEKDWMAAELVDLFSDARCVCQSMWSN